MLAYRAARIYDKQLNERQKAIELYREVVNRETDKKRWMKRSASAI